MSYLDRLKQKISQDMPRGGATKATKGAFVPFVATRSAPSRLNLSREAVSQVGGHVTADDCDLVLKAARPLPEALPDPVAEARRQKILAMLAERPGIRYAFTVDDPDTDPVILALAIRGVGTCELLIPGAKYDPFALLEWWNGSLG